MDKKSALLAAAAAAIFVSGGTALASGNGKATTDTVKCEGVNSCKGTSECATDHSACHGHNDCAGKGWIIMSAEECEKAKAAMEEQ